MCNDLSPGLAGKVNYLKEFSKGIKSKLNFETAEAPGLLRPQFLKYHNPDDPGIGFFYYWNIFLDTVLRTFCTVFHKRHNYEMKTSYSVS